MKFNFLTFLLFFVFNFQFIISAQDLSLSALTIPDSITARSNSVVRSDKTSIVLESSQKMTITKSRIVTVLNKMGNHESEIVIHYDKNRKIKSLDVVFYDAFGKELKKISKNKFEDYAAADGISLYNDGRLKYYEYIPTSLPYTMHLEYEIESANTAFINPWIPIDSYYQGIEESVFKISYADELEINNLEFNFQDFPIEKINQPNTIEYRLNNVKSLNPEEYSPSFYNIFPRATFASNKFHLEGYDGVASNWDEFSAWMYTNLIQPTNDLPEGTKTYIKNLVKDIDDPIERARKVYEFVQQKTRYISIQVGIGGWMPMLASEVDRLGYGDCKALTNYTKALMDAAGVETFYTAVFAGNQKRDIEKDLVAVQGNHVFLYLPSDNQDYWLECTSQSVPFGFQGNFTDDRDVLVISERGGKILHTPPYNEKNSIQHTKATYTLDAKGGITAEVFIKSTGLQYDNHFEIENKSQRDLNEYYKEDYWSHLNNLTLNNVSFKNDKKQISFEENLSITADNYASLSLNRVLFVLNPFNRYTKNLKRYKNRRFPVEISRGFYDIDEYIINLPEGYSIEAMPKNTEIINEFGTYNFTIEKLNDKKLKYSRSLLLKRGIHPKEAYVNFRKFIKNIDKLDHSKVVLTKN